VKESANFQGLLGSHIHTIIFIMYNIYCSSYLSRLFTNYAFDKDFLNIFRIHFPLLPSTKALQIGFLTSHIHKKNRDPLLAFPITLPQNSFKTNEIDLRSDFVSIFVFSHLQLGKIEPSAVETRLGSPRHINGAIFNYET
jgi:hypothetical protein